MKYTNDFHRLPMLSSVLNGHPSPDTVCYHNSLFFHSGQYITFLASKSSFFFNWFFPPRRPDPHAHRSFGIVPRQQQCDGVHLRSKLLLRELHKMVLLYKTVPESTSATWLWRIDPGWMPGAHQSCSITPLLSWTEGENITKGSWVKIRTGRDDSPITVMGKTDSTWQN